MIHPTDPKPVVLLSGANNNILLPTARIKLYTQDNREVLVKAILDSASQALVTTKLVKVLNLTPKQDFTNIIGVTNNPNNAKFSIPLDIYSLKTPFSTSVNCHVVDQITCNLPQTMIDPSTIQIPPNTELADEEFYKPSEINMLIGADVFFHVIQPSHETCSSSERSRARQPERSHQKSAQPVPEKEVPLIINTKLGHIIAGGLPLQNEVTKVVSLVCTKCETEINQKISEFWETEKVPEILCGDNGA